MNMTVAIYVLAIALMTMVADVAATDADVAATDADVAATDVELRDALQEYLRAAEDLDEVDFNEKNLNKLAKLFRMEDSPSDQRQANLWDWLVAAKDKVLDWGGKIKNGVKKGLNWAQKTANSLLGEAKCDEESLASAGMINSVRCKGQKLANLLNGKHLLNKNQKLNQLARLLMERSDR